MKKRLLCTLCLILVLACSLTIGVFSADTMQLTSENSLQIVAKSLSLKDGIRVNFKVSVAADIPADEVKLLVWEGTPADTNYTTESAGAVILSTSGTDANGYQVFQYCDVAAKEMGKTLYARAYYVNGNETVYSAPVRYSVVQYLDSQSKNESNTETYQNLLTSIRAYGAAAQSYFAEQGEETGILVTEPLYTVSVSDGTLSDGFTEGKFLNGESVTLVAKEIDGKTFVCWQDAAGNTVGDTAMLTLPVTGDAAYTAVYSENTFTEGLVFTYDSTTGTYSVTGYTGTATEVIIPATYTDGTNPVAAATSIGDWAFANCRNLETITFGENSQLTSIGEDAFYECWSLTSITIPASVTRIGNRAFYGCKSLTSITVPKGVTSIDLGVFRGCSSLESITVEEGNTVYHSAGNCLIATGTKTLIAGCMNSVIPTDGSVTRIGWSAFEGCSSLASITIPASVTRIDMYAFEDCSSLTSITIPASVTSIGEDAFNGCSSLESITVETGNTVYHSAGNCLIKTGAKTLIAGCKNSVIPADGSVTSIGKNAFYGCSSPTSITIPDSVISISRGAFSYCSSLTSITIPASVTSISEWTFAGCSSLKTVTFGENSQLTSIGELAFDDCSCLISINIPEGVTSIGKSAFGDCSSLISITIPEGVTSIGNWAFSRCSSLTSITIPANVTSIGEYAFYDCDSLKTVTFGENSQLTGIGMVAFRSCASLTSITIPASVTSIGDSAFEFCRGMTEINYQGTVAEWQAISKGTDWDSYTGEYVITCTDGTIAKDGTVTMNSVSTPGLVFELIDGTYTVTGYTGTATEVVIPATYQNVAVTAIGNSAFSGCSSLTSITVPASITSIGSHAFYNCSSLTSITIPASVTSIDNYAFGYCDGLETVIFAEGIQLTSIGNNAFYQCSSLTEINIPASVTDIDGNVFEGCSSLESITVETGNTVYHSADNCLIETATKALLAGCKNSVIPSDGSVTSIGLSAFEDCSGLTSITIPASITSIGTFAFSYCDGLETVTFSEKSQLTSINYWAFHDCSSLTSITIPASVTDIDGNVFNSCSGLESITVEEGNTVYHSAGNCLIETEAKTLIAGCNNSVIPSDGSVTVIGDKAFDESNLTSITIPASVTSIGEDAFHWCRSLETVIFVEGSQLISIGEDAFNWCSLTSITIPDSVTSIGRGAFHSCNNIIEYDGELYYVDKWVINCSSLDVETIFLPGDTVGIAEYAFDHAYDLTSIVYEGTVAEWQAKFHLYGYTIYCTDGTIAEDGTVTMNDYTSDFTFELIDGTYTVTGYTGTDTEVVIPATYQNVAVTAIGNSAFEFGISLTSITIPNTVTSIGYSAFGDYCSSLESITVEAGNTVYHSVDNCLIETATKTLVTGCKNSVIPSDGSVTSIGLSAFEDCSGLTSITIPASITSIGTFAFNYCDGLETVTFAEGSQLTGIDSYAFSDCRSLTSITIPASVTSIANNAFSDCSSLESITVEAGNTVYHSASNCLIETATKILVAGCKNSVIPTDGSVTSIGEWAFSSCSSLTSITIPASVTSIGNYAFYNCDSLTSITIPASVTSIGNSAFSSCNGLTSITIPASVIEIGEWAFSSCSSLTSITIPASVTSIGNDAFYNCDSLTSITIPASVTSIGNSAFSSCNGLTSITIPASVIEIGGWAFSSCSGLTEINYQGTVAEWQAISKGYNWDCDTGEYVIICTDGTIAKDGTVTMN